MTKRVEITVSLPRVNKGARMAQTIVSRSAGWLGRNAARLSPVSVRIVNDEKKETE